ncbi:hypothetical protein DFH27DRAFT_529367 [Peziza echinospora]|nr:hypothetical protein DFH27DRAFT_529367 [Peziza echinospora]
MVLKEVDQDSTDLPVRFLSKKRNLAAGESVVAAGEPIVAAGEPVVVAGEPVLAEELAALSSEWDSGDEGEIPVMVTSKGKEKAKPALVIKKPNAPVNASDQDFQDWEHAGQDLERKTAVLKGMYLAQCFAFKGKWARVQEAEPAC